MQNQSGDWMRHDSQQQQQAGSTSAAGLRISPVKKLSQESEAWFQYGNGTPSPTSTNGGSAQQKQGVGPGRLNGSQNWYKHEDGRTGNGSSPRRDLNPIGVSQPRLKGKPLTEERKAREAAAGNPNDWFHHDHQADAHEATPARSPRPSKKPSPSTVRESDDRTLWFAGVEATTNGSAGNTPRSGEQTARSRHANPQADAYYKRDKTGSGSDWFPHVHEAGDQPLSATSPTSTPSKQRQQAGSTGSKTGRMNLESPEWFSHEDPPAPKSPRPITSPEVRKMRDRASGDEVRQILRVDENLEHGRQQNNGGCGASGGSEGGSADVYTGSLVEKFQHQAVLTSELQ